MSKTDQLAISTLHDSAFGVLGATTHDDRKRIVELAEEKSLELDPDSCSKARADLTHPRTRLNAEIAWLPGVSPRQAIQLVENLQNDPMAIREASGLPTLAHLNLLAIAFEAVDDQYDAKDLVEFIMEMGYLANELDPQEILRDINQDRLVSGFPEVRALEQIEVELGERKRYFRGVIKDVLDRLPTKTIIQVMTNTVVSATSGGNKHAPELIDDLVDTYEVEAQDFLEREAANIHKLIKAAKDNAWAGQNAINSYVAKIDAVARNWGTITQPILMSSKARGIVHRASRDLATNIRGLAISLFNEHDMLDHSQRLIKLLRELFSDVPGITEQFKEDADALAALSLQRKPVEGRNDDWARAIIDALK